MFDYSTIIRTRSESRIKIWRCYKNMTGLSSRVLFKRHGSSSKLANKLYTLYTWNYYISNLWLKLSAKIKQITMTKVKMKQQEHGDDVSHWSSSLRIKLQRQPETNDRQLRIGQVCGRLWWSWFSENSCSVSMLQCSDLGCWSRTAKEAGKRWWSMLGE